MHLYGLRPRTAHTVTTTTTTTQTIMYFHMRTETSPSFGSGGWFFFYEITLNGTSISAAEQKCTRWLSSHHFAVVVRAY